MSADNDNVVAEQPQHNELYRKINNSSPAFYGQDNHGFDFPHGKKVSGTSDHAEHGPTRKKSILHHPMAEGMNHHDIGKLQ